MRYFTSEQVAFGHPDKFCDLLSDRLLTAYLENDPNSKCAIECAAKSDEVFILGEVTSSTEVFLELEATSLAYDLYGTEPEVHVVLDQQSPEIFSKVKDGGAGDQGVMTGFATNETPWFLPKPYIYATKILQGVVNSLIGKVVGPDAKSQVTLNSDGEIEHIILSAQQADPNIDFPLFQETIEDLIFSVLRGTLLDDSNPQKISINPGGTWFIGGPMADAGLTGRKLSADTYGPLVPHGGGAFSGKDPSKVDRSGAYMARFVAKNLVNQGLAERVQVQVAYEIGSIEPVSLDVNTFGTGDETLARSFVKEFDWSPEGIISRLSLRSVNYADFATWGHFTNADAPWEQLIK